MESDRDETKVQPQPTSSSSTDAIPHETDGNKTQSEDMTDGATTGTRQVHA